jgi:hypothetical protein
MKTFITILCVLSATYYANAQLLLRLEVDPPNPTNADSITIKAPIAFFNGCLKLDSSIVQNGDSFIINACYDYGWGSLGLCKDTALYHLGILSNGTYTVKYIVHATEDDFTDFTCAHYNRVDSITKTFTVGPTAILETTERVFMIFPNAANDKLQCSFNGLEYGLHYQVFAADGRRLLQNNISQSNFEIDISSLPPGLYVIQLQDEKQRWVKKFVKY